MSLHQRATAAIAATRDRMATPANREHLDRIWKNRDARIQREAEKAARGRSALKRTIHRLAVEPTEAP